MTKRIRTGDPRHFQEDIHKLQDEVAELKHLIRCGSVVTFLGQQNLELRGMLASEFDGTRLNKAVCATCDCPLVLEGEEKTCRTCDHFDWLAH